jgi:hypothetical protein
MAYFIAAGFVAPRQPVFSGNKAARPQTASGMHKMAATHTHGCLLDRISSGICDNATRLHRLDLERIASRTEQACRLKDRLTDLKDQMARSAAARARSADADRTIELARRAS